MSQATRTPNQANFDVQTVIQKHIAEIPEMGLVQVFWRNLADMREWWLILGPLLLWVGWRTYTHERRQVLQEREQRQQAAAQDTPAGEVQEQAA
jgi:hypothetical protein